MGNVQIVQGIVGWLPLQPNVVGSYGCPIKITKDVLQASPNTHRY